MEANVTKMASAKKSIAPNPELDQFDQAQDAAPVASYRRMQVSPLRDERVILRFIPKRNALAQDKGHVLYGGMGEKSERDFTVPIRQDGSLMSFLDDTEIDFLEEYMGLEHNALSIGGGKQRWLNYKVRLFKHDTYLDLSNPEDYIRYKILLANADYICPSQEEYKRRPKASYQYMMIRETEKDSLGAGNTKLKTQCYIELDKIKDDKETLRCVAEILDKHPHTSKPNLEFFQNKAGEHIERDPAKFLSTVTDKYLPTKVMLMKAVENGVVAVKGDLYYLISDGSPLCDRGEQPTLHSAAVYLNTPRNTQTKLDIEAELNKILKKNA